jgi:hypothetical protein
MAPTEYSLFPKVKSNLKGLHFVTILDIQNDVMSELKSILAADSIESFRSFTTTLVDV